jgi:hypothetical protein
LLFHTSLSGPEVEGQYALWARAAPRPDEQFWQGRRSFWACLVAGENLGYYVSYLLALNLSSKSARRFWLYIYQSIDILRMKTEEHFKMI